MSISTIRITADTIKKRKKIIKSITIILTIIFTILIFLFLILSLIYKGGGFVISLDPNLSSESGLHMFESLDTKDSKTKLQAKNMDFIDNISINWLPKNINNEGEGSHNGESYIAYTFYIENQGENIVNYWYEILIEDVIKNVDEAIRIMVFNNDDKKVYAKINADTKKEEAGTIAFYSDKIAVLEPRNSFKPGDLDKITIVIWLEGDDPDCVDNIIGGEIKAHMKITEGHIQQKGN